MTRRPIRTAFLATLLGVGIALGSAALPAQANKVGMHDATFEITTHIQDIGDSVNLGSTGQGKRLEAIYVTQLGDKKMCVRAHVAEVGWQDWRCTSGKGTRIMAGTTGQGRGIESVSFNVPGKTLWAQAHVRNLGWMPSKTMDSIVNIGTTGLGLPMEAFYLGIYTQR